MKRLKSILIPILVIMLILSGCKNNEFTISFDTDGGSIVSSQNITKKDNIKEPTPPTKEGYNFIGWYHNDELWDFSEKITKDIKLVAKWEKVTDDDETEKYTVTFNTNGGSIVQSQTIDKNNKVTKPDTPIKEGYKFVEWTLDGETYNFNNKVNKNMILIAKWEKVESKPVSGSPTPSKPAPVTKLTIKFDSNGGTKVSNQTINKGSRITKPDTPKKNGYVFVGWYNGNTEWNFAWTTNINLTLKAKWKKEEIKPIADKYTIRVEPTDQVGAVEALVYVQKNGKDITQTVDEIVVNDRTLAIYSPQAKALRVNLSQYNKYKNEQLKVVIKGKSYKISKN